MHNAALAVEQRPHFHNNIGSFVAFDWAGGNYDTWTHTGYHSPLLEKLFVVTMCSGLLLFVLWGRRVEQLVVVAPLRGSAACFLRVPAGSRQQERENSKIAEALADEILYHFSEIDCRE